MKTCVRAVSATWCPCCHGNLGGCTARIPQRRALCLREYYCPSSIVLLLYYSKGRHQLARGVLKNTYLGIMLCYLLPNNPLCWHYTWQLAIQPPFPWHKKGLTTRVYLKHLYMFITETLCGFYHLFYWKCQKLLQSFQCTVLHNQRLAASIQSFLWKSF